MLNIVCLQSIQNLLRNIYVHTSKSNKKSFIHLRTLNGIDTFTDCGFDFAKSTILYGFKGEFAERADIKMKPLATYQHVLKMLCAFPPDESTERWKKVLFVISGLSIFVCILCTATSSLTFVLKHLINNPAEGLWALFQVCGLTNMLYVLIISFVIRFKIKEIFDKLSQIYNMSKWFAIFNSELVHFIRK